MEGKVKWYKKDKGFGFIAGDDGVDYFVHSSQVPKFLHLREGDVVSFDGVDGERGKKAENLKLVQKSAQPAGNDHGRKESAQDEYADEVEEDEEFDDDEDEEEEAA